MQVRCPICNGSGIVEPLFGMGNCRMVGTAAVCPGCEGSGMQWKSDVVAARFPKHERIIKPLWQQNNRDMVILE